MRTVLSALALASSCGLAQAQTCGFDHIGPSPASLGSIGWASSQLPVSTAALTTWWNTASTWTPEFDQRGKVLWGVVRIPNEMDPNDVASFNVSVWDSAAAADASPYIGNYYHRSTDLPDFGDPFTALPGAGTFGQPTYIIGMDLSDITFEAGTEYWVSLFAENDSSFNGLFGVVRTSFFADPDYQWGTNASVAPGWNELNVSLPLMNTGVLAYRLDTSSVFELGAGCGGLNPTLSVDQDCPTVGQALDLSVSGLTPQAAGFVYGSVGETPGLDLGFGCQIYLDTQTFFALLPIVADGSGDWSNTFTVPSNPALAGETFTFQGATLGSSPIGVDLTSGLRFAFGA